MTIESFRSMASSATALVRSMVRSTEFICRRKGSKGDSRSTTPIVSLCLCSYPGRVATYIPCCRNSYPQAPLGISYTISLMRSDLAQLQARKIQTYNLRIALTTARVYGAVLVDEAMLPNPRLAVAENMQRARSVPLQQRDETRPAVLSPGKQNSHTALEFHVSKVYIIGAFIDVIVRLRIDDLVLLIRSKIGLLQPGSSRKLEGRKERRAVTVNVNVNMSARTDTEASANQNTSGITPDTLQATLKDKLEAQHVDIADLSGNVHPALTPPFLHLLSTLLPP